MKKLLLISCALLFTFVVRAQETFPVNGPYDVRPGLFAFTNANIVVSADQTISNGVLLVKDRVIEAVGANVGIPKGYVVIDLKGKYIYPGLIDAYTTYGMPDAPKQEFSRRNRFAPVNISTKPGAYGWNEAIRPEMEAKEIFHADVAKSEDLKKNGFTVVQSLIHDGIARGTSVAVTLGAEEDNFVMLNDNAAANYSFSKGSSSNDYPASLMGSIALIRQTYYDADWYKNQTEETNFSLAAFNKEQSLPQIFEVGDALGVMRAYKIGKEFGKDYIFKTEGDEYRRIDAMKNTGASFIIPLTFPEAYDVEDPMDARKVSYAQLKDWELAPTNPATMEKAGIRFAITSYGLQNAKDFWANLRTAIDNGLSEKQALQSLTTIPAQMLNIADKTGTLEKGKLANFIITSDDLFKKENIIYENWIEGRKYQVSRMDVTDLRGKYTISSDELAGVKLNIAGTPGEYEVNISRDADSLHTKGTFTRNGDLVSVYFDLKKPAGSIRLDGHITNVSPLTFRGNGTMPDGTDFKWTATYTAPATATPPHPTPKAEIAVGPVIYPFGAYGAAQLPKQQTTLFKNATVWTCEKDGILKNTDVLIENGKIKAIGKGLAAPAGAVVVDATGKHLSPGIVDEHSHIAVAGSVNEGTQAVTSEVRIADVLNPEDISIYRQLAGGVTTSHILHGSANPIGGQTQLIKHRWGVLADEMKFDGADGFIKFALGENVKQTNWGIPEGTPNMRYPQSRMGVEQVYVDEFTRAKEYEAARAVKGNHVRRDLELDAIVEILNKKRFITCHSYVQSEINMLMKVGDTMGFKVNTFTHILEGYKVADKMKARGIYGSTFSDWWAYKMEVTEAIPYNGALMHDEGVLVAFNSDDDEMARRLNQEAGKAVTYGKVPEEEALKFVTINPATMLHVENRVGSIKVGKDADLALWSADPLSIYAVCEKTFVDGIPYWDIAKDAANQKAMHADEGRIIEKMIAAKNKGASTQRPMGRRPRNDEDDEDDEFVSGGGSTNANAQTQSTITQTINN